MLAARPVARYNLTNDQRTDNPIALPTLPPPKYCPCLCWSMNMAHSGASSPHSIHRVSPRQKSRNITNCLDVTCSIFPSALFYPVHVSKNALFLCSQRVRSSQSISETLRPRFPICCRAGGGDRADPHFEIAWPFPSWDHWIRRF